MQSTCGHPAGHTGHGLHRLGRTGPAASGERWARGRRRPMVGRPRDDTQKLVRATFRTASNFRDSTKPSTGLSARRPWGLLSCADTETRRAERTWPQGANSTHGATSPARAAPAARWRGKAVHVHPVGQHSQHKDHSSRPQGQAARGTRLRWRAADPQGTSTTGGAAPYEAASSGSRGFQCHPWPMRAAEEVPAGG